MGDDKSSFQVASFSYYLDIPKHNTMLHKISPHEQIPILFTSDSQHTNNPNLCRLDSFSYLHHRGGAPSNSTGSDVSSYNSQISLQPKQKKGVHARRLFLGGFWFCFDKKAVHLTQLAAENILEEPRNSIEVFGGGATLKGEVAKNLERKLSMLTWDAIPKPQSSAVVGDVDVASVASSDLFEIENISGAAHPIRADDDASSISICMSPASQYAPSEASIQWSVVTASAVDYSAASDCNDDMSVSVAGEVMKRRSNKEARMVKGRHGHGGFLGCRSQKAVDVVQNVAGKNQDRENHPTVRN